MPKLLVKSILGDCARVLVNQSHLELRESFPAVSDGRKNSGNHQSQTQSVLLYAELPNFTEKQRETAKMNLLDEVAAEAARLAEAQTQPAGLDAEEDSVEVETVKMAGHCVKREAVPACEDGGLEGRPVQIDDCENTTIGKTSRSGSEETGQAARQEQNQNPDLLQQMTLLCQTVQKPGKQMLKVRKDEMITKRWKGR